MTFGYRSPLYILALDHRGSVRKKLFGIQGKPTAEQDEAIREAKGVIFDGYRRAIAEGAPMDAAGLLVDEQYGAKIAKTAKADGYIFAMPLEKSGQDEFDLEFGDAFGEHVERFDPTFAKVLVRYNPEGDQELNRRQAERLRGLSDWLHARERRFLFELLVPATQAQLAAVEGDGLRYDLEVRPRLMVGAVRELQGHGVEPDVWKIEGLEAPEDCERVAEQARAGGRSDVACVVLGRGADDDAVVRWLRAGAGVAGYVGFAIGRSIWWQDIEDFIQGSKDRAAAVGGIAERFLRYIEVYRSAS